ncbi:hypothetical protein MNBD_ALPHA07-710 [hydrothermal vent metagenome]|uniref:Uncharacterized protein n=1 Tax=hydrothermal vent metagenome TaxID=652676 RepID=A0A3B0RS14_9ZZZZ
MMYGGYGYMGGGMIWMMLVAAVLLCVPFWRILPRVGIPSWAALFAIFPPFALILLWVVAFKDKIDGSGGNG